MGILYTAYGMRVKFMQKDVKRERAMSLLYVPALDTSERRLIWGS